MKVTAVDDKKLVKKGVEERIDEKISLPGVYEITEKSTFRIEFKMRKIENRWVIINDVNSEEGDEAHWVEFRMWSFDEEVELRKRAMIFDEQRRMHFIDTDLLDRMKIQRLMKSWSFEAISSRYRLLHCDNILVDESFNIFRKLQPNIARYIINRMNEVLDGSY